MHAKHLGMGAPVIAISCKDICATRERAEEEGLNKEGTSFCGALAQNESAVGVTGDKHLKVIAHELLG